MAKPPEAQAFTWRGRDRYGHARQGQAQAASAAALVEQLRQQGVYQAQVRRAPSVRARGGIGHKDLTLLTRQLATMMQAGITLLHAFDVAARSARTPAVRALIQAVREQVEQGLPLHRAFARFRPHFDALYCATVASGEASGALDEVLEGLAQHMEKTQALRAKVRSALMYPSVVAIVTLSAVTVIMVWMVPAFETQFANFGAALPLPTQWVVALSRGLSTHGLWLLAGLSLLALWLMRAWRRGGRTRAAMERGLLRLPLLGGLLHQAAVARWARTLATLTHAGVPLLEAMQVTGHAAGHVVFVEASQAIAEAINHGSSLSEAMRKTQAFPDVVVHMCALGEESGTLDTMLAKSAAMLEGDVDQAVAGLSSTLEPLMILVLGVVIGAILLAMYLPIFQLGRVI